MHHHIRSDALGFFKDFKILKVTSVVLLVFEGFNFFVGEVKLTISRIHKFLINDSINTLPGISFAR